VPYSEHLSQKKKERKEKEMANIQIKVNRKHLKGAMQVHLQISHTLKVTFQIGETDYLWV
jgi:hypothetical protein